MDLTDEHLEVAFGAYVASRDGNGVVVTDDAIPVAQELAAYGWLEQRIEDGGERSYWWTRRAETALNLGGLMNSAEDRQN